MEQEIEIDGAWAAGDRALADHEDGHATGSPLVAVAAVAGLAAAVQVLGLVLPWSDGGGSVLSLTAYPGQVISLATFPTLSVLLAVGAAQGRWWRGAVAASLVAAPAVLWQFGPTLWELRDVARLGPGFIALNLGGVLALLAVLMGLVAAVQRSRGVGGPAADVAVVTAAAVGTGLLVLSWTRDQIEITDGQVTTGVGQWLRLEIPQGSLLGQLAYVAAPVAAVAFVAWTALAARWGMGLTGRHRVEVWAGLAAGVGLDVLQRATSVGDLRENWSGLAIVGDPPTVAPAVLGLASTVGAVVALLVAGWLDAPAVGGEAAEPEEDGSLGVVDDAAWAAETPATTSPEQA